jgi:hypothetical protein
VVLAERAACSSEMVVPAAREGQALSGPSVRTGVLAAGAAPEAMSVRCRCSVQAGPAVKVVSAVSAVQERRAKLERRRRWPAEAVVLAVTVVLAEVAAKAVLAVPVGGGRFCPVRLPAVMVVLVVSAVVRGRRVTGL